jgi:hypothetical protein
VHEALLRLVLSVNVLHHAVLILKQKASDSRAQRCFMAVFINAYALPTTQDEEYQAPPPGERRKSSGFGRGSVARHSIVLANTIAGLTGGASGHADDNIAQSQIELSEKN